MIMMGLEFTGAEPFSDVHITSIIQAPDGRRMSKSLGTGIDPIDLIEGGPRPPVFAQGDQPAGEFPAYGADAVRWGLLAMSSGQDVRFSEDKVAQGQQLTNKLWNAARLILLGVEGADGAQAPVRAAPMPSAVEDRWILSRLERARSDLAVAIERFDFSHAALGLYDFVYGELCDWYLELVKPRLRAGEPELLATLLHVLSETVALAHPLIPFETEEIYSLIPGTEGLLAARVSNGTVAEIDSAAEDAVQRAIGAIQELRRWRDLTGVKAGAQLGARLEASGYEDTIEHVGRLARLTLDDGANGAQPVATVPIPGGQVQIFAGADVDAEGAAKRLAQRRDKLSAEIERAQRKLANEGFVAKARAEVVQAERDKLARLQAELEAL
jgi:valyl-tRNA synthetase